MDICGFTCCGGRLRTIPPSRVARNGNRFGYVLIAVEDGFRKGFISFFFCLDGTVYLSYAQDANNKQKIKFVCLDLYLLVTFWASGICIQRLP